MSSDTLLAIHNGMAFEESACPILRFGEFRRTLLEEVAEGARVAAFFGRPTDGDALRLVAVLARAERGDLAVASTEVDHEYPSLTPDCPQVHWFEREIAEQWNVRPIGHPWLKPIRFQPPRRGERNGRSDVLRFPGGEAAPDLAVCGVTDFFRMEGDEVHEVAVGPVHAGIIEPGHFRFQCHGEQVYHLEISLGYQHRGVERALVCGPKARAIHLMETLSGDTTVGHATAYCRLVESLSKHRVSARAQVLRGVAMELERIANHVGDLGALSADVGFLPTMSYCGRIRGDVLNLTATLCGNRFGRGLIRPGGVAWDVEPAMVDSILERLGAIMSDARNAIELLWNTPSVMARFDATGVISQKTCRQIGLVGVPARACGEECDVRNDFPYGIFRFAHIPVSSWNTGDVFARAYVRWLEIQRSAAFVREQLESLPEGTVLETPGPCVAGSMAVSLVEGWRGEICHTALTGAAGEPVFYKVVDPSFHNWFGLAWALRNQAISDFPLCNKSFNLSYCGHDL